MDFWNMEIKDEIIRRAYITPLVRRTEKTMNDEKMHTRVVQGLIDWVRNQSKNLRTKRRKHN